jgi:hypothetical protein
MLRTENEIFAEGAVETKQTTIGGDAKIAFAILSGMVTDSIEYSIREPGTNAWEANRKRPFELTLPTRFNNTISWRDFGKGLSHTFMMTRYAKIGDSTKDGSDDEVGGWGFGSKSPLSYLMHQDGAGAFNVVSRHQGMRRAYVIGINAKGRIQISCLAEEVMDESDRGTGLEVSFPVQEKDIARFVSYVDRIYWGFSPAPVVLPADTNRPTIGRGTIKAQGPNWTLYDAKHAHRGVSTPWSGPHIRVGCVLYPVQLHLLDGLTGFLTQSDNLLIEAPIGSVDVSTSREQLSYTDRTKAALSELFSTYETGLVGNIQAEADKATDYFTACRIARQGCDVLGWERAKGLFARITWNGIPCREEIFENTSSSGRIRACPIGGGHGFKSSFKAEIIHPSNIAGATIAVEHSAYRSVERLEHAGLIDRTKTVLWVRCTRDKLPELYATLGIDGSDVVVLDSIKLPKRDAKDLTGPKVKMRVRKQLTWTGYDHTSSIDMLAGGLYVAQTTGGRRYDYKYVYPSGHDRSDDVFKSIRCNGFPAFMKEFAALDILTDEDRERPILIKKDDETLEGDWISLGDFIKQRIEDKLDTAQLTPRFAWSKSSFSDELYKLARGFTGMALPPVLDDLRVRTLDLLAQVQGVKQADVFNDHDKRLEVLKQLCREVTVPMTADPSVIIANEWTAFCIDHPILPFMLDEMRCQGSWDANLGEYATEASPTQRKLIENYFTMAAAAGML